MFFNVSAIKGYFPSERRSILSFFRSTDGNSDNRVNYANRICRRLIDANVHNSRVIVSVP